MSRRGAGALRPLAQLLVAAVTGTAPPDLPDRVRDFSEAQVIEAGGMHRVTPAIEQLIRGWSAPPEAWRPPLAAIKHAQVMRHLRALHDLRIIGAALDDASIGWVAVKGPVLAGTIWPSVTMREYFDLDLIVDRRRFADAVDAVVATGGELLDRNWPLLRDTMRAELAMTAVHGTPLDLHWHIAVPSEVRSAYRFDVAEMLERARPIDLGQGLVVPTLDAVDTAMHVAFHAAQSGANRLVWLADLRFAVAQPWFDWAEFERRGRQARALRTVAMVAERTRRVLGLPEPAEAAIGELSLGLWGRLAAWRDERHPFPGLPDDRRLGGNLYSSARERLLPTAIGLVRHHVASRREGRRHDSGRSEGRVLRRHIPDAGARAEYLHRTQATALP